MKNAFTIKRFAPQKRFSFSLVLLLSLVIARPAMAQDITINLNNPRQSIDGVGFCHEGDRQNGDNYVINTPIQQMLDNNMTLFRDMFPNKIWEPSKGTYNYTDQRIVNCFQRLKTMQDRGIKTILGIWDVPNWMVSNPSAGGGRRINNFDDFAWFIYSFLQRGKDVYGLTIDYVDVNETAESGVNIYLTAQEYITLIQKCQVLFTANGIQTKMSIGGVLLWDIQYDKDIYNAVKNLSVAGYPNWHTYGWASGSLQPVSLWQGWGDWQQTLDRNLWGTETDYDAFYYNNPDRLTWQGIKYMAIMYYRNYYISRLSTSAGWYWHPEWPSNNIHTAYMNYFEPGGQVVEASQPSSDILTVAYKHVSKNKFVIQVLNQATGSRQVTFHGVPANKPLTLKRTSEAGDRSTTVGTYTPNGTDFTITLQASSFNTFYGELSAGADTQSPTVPANFISTAKTTTSISLAWDASTDNVAVTGYQVFGAGNTLLGSSSTTSLVLQNLTPNTSYTLVVKAYDSAGNFSGASNSITVTTNPVTTGPAVVYSDCNFSGNPVALGVGNYTLAQLQASGAVNDDISSVQVQSGYRVTLFADNNFAGASLQLTANDNCLSDNSFNDMASSIRVETYSPNLAYNRPVSTTSNESASYTGDKAVDANGTTRWSSAYANNQSIVVDLGANYSVTRVRLAWESAYARDYQIQFSTNNSTWTTVREFWGKSSADADDQTGLTGTARYVKVYCINRATAYGFSLFEFEIYGTLSGARTAGLPDASISSPGMDKLVVFPNPVKEAVSVQMPAGWQGAVQAAVFNATGQLMLSQNINKNVQSIPLTGLPAGVYILRLTRGTEHITKKILKD
jgi:hypothetical protein